MSRDLRRRRFVVGTTAALALAGCLDEDDDDGMDGMEDDGMESMDDNGMEDDDGGMGDDNDMGDDDDMDGMEDTNRLSDHPVGRNIEDQPTLGAAAVDEGATLVVLDDPSCPRCAAFHENTLTELEANYVGDGDLTIVSRPYPVVYEWGGPAAHALEATFHRDEEAFWDLSAHYFDEQGSFDADNALDMTETWLEAHTDLDAAEVVTDVREDRFAGRIDATIQAGEDAGAGGVTPASFLFLDGEFQTSLNGSVSPVTIETVLGL